MSLNKSLIIAAGICASLYISRKIFWYFAEKHIRNKRKYRGIDYLRINRGISFGLDEMENKCPDPKHNVYCRNWKSCNEGKLNFLLDLIRGAKKSVDVCVYIIISDKIGQSIIEAKQKGAKIRVITDADMALSKNSFIHKFTKRGGDREERFSYNVIGGFSCEDFSDKTQAVNTAVTLEVSTGIAVKFKHSNFIMHHKFVVIDNEIVIMGSMNFTPSALNSNWESVVVTSIPKFVKDFSQTFDKLWRYMDK